MTTRRIIRVALLQNYEGMPEKLLKELDELPAKGYTTAFFTALDELEPVRLLCARAVELGLETGVFTGYMKYNHKYLAAHPDQGMVFAENADDQDGLGTTGWGCAFNPDFKERYFDRLRECARLPGMTQIDLNDEAYMGTGCYCRVCRKAWADETGLPMPCKPHPTADDWRDPVWRRYLQWRMDRWNAVHREMAAIVRAANPRVRVSFQSSPAVDLWWNPWFSAVDLAAMARDLDCISTDPYYTFHRRIFDPAEVYLSEWSRFLYGAMRPDKIAGIYPQGFSHPTFTRPLGEADGIWSSVVPQACGVSLLCPYTYTLQRSSPVQKAYESCFPLDRHFERMLPLDYAGVVHGLRSEVFAHPLPLETPRSYDGTRLFPVCAALRHGGVPYGFVPDARLADPGVAGRFAVLVLPEVVCLSGEEREGLRAFIRGGGHALILGDLGSRDATGGEAPSLLEELFGIRLGEALPDASRFSIAPGHPSAEGIQYPDPEVARRMSEGTMAPLFTLTFARRAELPPDATVIASFEKDDGTPLNAPAAAAFERYGGRVLWLAGFPTLTAPNRAFGTTVQNLAHQFVARATEWTAGRRPALRVEGWPPDVPMRRLRPLDPRFMTTFEFMPLKGDGGYMGAIASYFREPATFPMVLRPEGGERVRRIVELLSGLEVPIVREGPETAVTVRLTPDTPALVYLFELV